MADFDVTTVFTFSGRRAYFIASSKPELAQHKKQWHALTVQGCEFYGMYPPGTEGDEAYQEALSKLPAADPFADEVLADKYTMAIQHITGFQFVDVEVSHVEVRDLEPRYSCWIRKCSSKD